MATLTVRDAARRLGVKPSKVRLYISQRKLSARAAPHAPDRRPGDRILLDADEVDTLAQLRAQKRRQRSGATPSTNGAGGSAHPAAEPGVPATVAAGSEQIAPPAELLPEQTAPTVDRAGWQAAVVIQPLLQPLVVELHDARETIRRQAEELGVLRATVADLQRRVQLTVDAGATVPALASAGDATSHENAPRGAGRPRTLAAATPTQAPPWHIPLWQRALTHWLR